MKQQSAEALATIVRTVPAAEWLNTATLKSLLQPHIPSHDLDLIAKALDLGFPQMLLRGEVSVNRVELEVLSIRLSEKWQSDTRDVRAMIAVWAAGLGVMPFEDSQDENDTEKPANIEPGELVSYVQDEAGNLIRKDASSKERPTLSRKQVKKENTRKGATSQNARRSEFDIGHYKMAFVAALILICCILAYSGFNSHKYPGVLFVCAAVALIAAVWIQSIPTCLKCNSAKLAILSKRLIGSGYLYARKDGERDRRYNYNPLVNTYSVSHGCMNCQYRWDTQETSTS